MPAEIGHYALVLAFAVSIVQAILPLIGAARRDASLTAVAAPAAKAQFLLVAVAYGALTWSFVTSDFSVSNVAANSNSLQPMIYKFSSVWGNHEGSMVLWVLMLTLFGALVAVYGGALPETLRARILAVQSIIGAAFLAFILFTSNPFLRLDPAPLDGRDLNPLLQDPGLAFHPPFLYLGYVGFSMAFSFAVAALIEGKVDPAWGRWVRPWTLVAWSSLTLGIGMGSWWAYYELGWGGWWYWDPVENASFMPWLVGTALLHSAIVVEKRDALKTWTILLAILTFSLSLMGTFLVRSGVLTSVHAFAVDPERGVFILGILIATIGGSLTLFAWRAPHLKGGGVFAPISREGGLVLNNLFLTVACAAVFIGTLYPLLLEAITGEKISVGPPFFNATFIPIIIPLLLLAPIGPLLAWKRADLAGVTQRLFAAAAAAIGVTILTVAIVADASVLSAVAMGLAGWLVIGSAAEITGRIALFRVAPGDSWRRARNLPRSMVSMTVAHAGMGVLVAGIVGVSAWREEVVASMKPGDTAEIGGYVIEFRGATGVDGPNWKADRGLFVVTKDGAPYTRLFPEKRFYPVAGTQTTEAAISTSGAADLYAVLGDFRGDGTWTTRFYYNPLVPWIWVGVLMMVGGGLVGLSDRRHRIGAPMRPKARKAAGARPAGARA